MKQTSESKKSNELKSDEPVVITAVQKNEVTFTGRFVDLSSNNLRIKLNAGLEIGSLQRLEVGNSLMMTEVHDCEPDKDEFSAGLLILSWIEKAELKRFLREAVTGPAQAAA